jgi:serine/threonine-protein kinase
MSALTSERPGKACSSCGHVNPSLARFCNQCGLSFVTNFMADTLHLSSPPASLPMSDRSLGLASTRPPAAHASFHPPTLHERSTNPRELADPLIGVVVADRYRIREPIGRGGMGVVYRVEHARIGKLMALKLLTGELTRDASQVARFKREAQLVSQLSHPNTVQVFDFGASDGLVYLAMEFLKGEDLGRLIRRSGPLGVERTLKIVIQICSSLAEAHEKGMVHRDLKPENIIIVHGQHGEDVVKVLDFGLAKLRDSGELSEVTSRGAIVGTPYYMSPEQIRGDDVGPEGDVYALGALMYACLTATVVFDAATPMGVLTKHLTEQPLSPSRRCPELDIPETVSQIVLAALEKDPRQRIRSVLDLQKLLLLELEHGGKRDAARLLDFSHLRQAVDADSDAATRDEVERYERKLRQRGYAVYAVLAIAALAGLVLGARAYERWQAPPQFTGSEIEPNDAASEATLVPFPFDARGVIGVRLDQQRGDRDFYRFGLPGPQTVALETSGLPHMALCTLLYASGSDEPFGRYCPGAPGKRLTLPALKLPAGQFVLTVLQDREAYTRDPPPVVLESISDAYTISLKPSARAAGEIEPNDFPRHASVLAPGETHTGQLAWARDIDVWCSSDPARQVIFLVTDSQQRPRARAAALQVTPLAGPEQEIPVRVHRAGHPDVTASERDVLGTWRSSPILPSPGKPACIQLVLVPNPWAPTPHPLVAPAGDETYTVELTAAP